MATRKPLKPPSGKKHSANFTPRRPPPALRDPKRIQNLLRDNETLQPFHAQLQKLATLQKTFADALPAGLINSCRIAAWEGKLIVVASANGAVAAKLKQMLPRLLQIFRENKMQDQEVTGISVIVQPEFFPPIPPPKKLPPRAPIPPGKLTELAETLSDSPLKRVLEGIANQRKRALTARDKNQ